MIDGVQEELHHKSKTIDILRERFPDLVLPARDDLCYATKNRQDAVRRIAAGELEKVVLARDVVGNQPSRPGSGGHNHHQPRTGGTTHDEYSR